MRTTRPRALAETARLPAPRAPELELAILAVIGFLLVYARSDFPSGPLREIAIVDARSLPALVVVQAIPS